MCPIFGDVDKKPHRLSFAGPIFHAPRLPGFTLDFTEASKFIALLFSSQLRPGPFLE